MVEFVDKVEDNKQSLLVCHLKIVPTYGFVSFLVRCSSSQGLNGIHAIMQVYERLWLPIQGRAVLFKPLCYVSMVRCRDYSALLTLKLTI